MEVLQNEEPVELQGKKDENGSGEHCRTSKPKNEESDVQTVKKSKEEKGKKKDEKTMEQLMKTLNTLGSSEEKLAVMYKKYSDLVEENKKIQQQFKQSEKKMITLQRVKDQLQSEQSKAVLTRSRLENLCRELQRQNKAIKEESLLKIREEEEKRKVVSAKFQTALGEITALMQQNNENHSKLKEDNLEMQNKFKTLCEQYELREQQIEKMSKQMQLESQLADVKLAKVKIGMFAENELLANEKDQLLVELNAYKNKCQEMQKTEAALRNQISMYNEKYDEFQSALAKSNQIYSGFKSEIDKMSKKITKLEKETSVWKMKWEGSHKALLQMATEKQQRDAELALKIRQLNQLQKLCRTLQSERTSLINQLKNEGHTPKVEAGNDSTAGDSDIVNDSEVQNVKETTSSIVDGNLELKDESNSNVDVPEVSEKGEVQLEKCTVEGMIEEMTSIISSIAEENKPVIETVTNNNEDSKETVEEGKELKSAENSSISLVGDSKKKDQDGTKSAKVSEPKKGKDGSKKKKK